MDGFRVEGSFEKSEKHEIISCKWKQGKKEITADGILYEKVIEHIGKYAAVMIAPDDMELVNDGSELRRKWIDSILSQVDKEYLEKLMQYQRVLAQRNAWLKMQALGSTTDRHSLDYYNAQLTENGTYIHQQRATFIIEFIPMLVQFYADLSGGKETLSMNYESDLLQKPLNEWLANSLQIDLRFQRTSRGIHKDDWGFLINELSLKQFGSQGQKKSFLFALKLAQYAYLSKQQNAYPILLLDDIFEKLDQSRMEALLRIIRSTHFGQVILTDTHPERVKAAFGEDVELGFINL